MNFTKNDFYILDTIYTLKITNPLGAIPVSRFLGTVDLSHTKIRSSLKKLIEAGYVAEGYKEFNARTYYITAEGIKMVTNMHEQNKELIIQDNTEDK